MSRIERIIAASLSGLATAVILVVVCAAANLQGSAADPAALADPGAGAHSHSMVAGGFPVTS
jgi:hypothetical protein